MLLADVPICRTSSLLSNRLMDTEDYYVVPVLLHTAELYMFLLCPSPIVLLNPCEDNHSECTNVPQLNVLVPSIGIAV